jgi:hypothetical protein
MAYHGIYGSSRGPMELLEEFWWNNEIRQLLYKKYLNMCIIKSNCNEYIKWDGGRRK